MNIKEIAIYLKNDFFNSQKELNSENTTLTCISCSKQIIPELEQIDINELERELQKYDLKVEYANKLASKRRIYKTTDNTRIIVYQNVNDL